MAKAFLCPIIFLSQLAFAAIYPCPKTPISLPSPRGVDFLDDWLEEVGFIHRPFLVYFS